MAHKVKGLRLRPELRWFAEQMEIALRENDHKGGWRGHTQAALFKRLREESDELAEVLSGQPRPFRTIKEAADVANFSMFIADISELAVRTGLVGADVPGEPGGEFAADVSDCTPHLRDELHDAVSAWLARVAPVLPARAIRTSRKATLTITLRQDEPELFAEGNERQPVLQARIEEGLECNDVEGFVRV